MLPVSGCTSNTNIFEQPTATVKSVATLPVITEAAIPSPIATAFSIPTVQPTPTITIENDCLSIEDQLPTSFQLTGVWIRNSADPYLENLEEHTKYRIPVNGGGRLGRWAISPSGKWIAYLDGNLDTSERIIREDGSFLRVIHSSGHSLSMNYWPLNTQLIVGWVDDRHLLLEINWLSEDKRHFVVLNPFSGEWKYFAEPDWLLSLPIERDRYSSSVTYSPRLDEVLFAIKDHSELRDFKTGKLIFGDSTIGLFQDINWSPDGTMLAILTNKGTVIHIFQNSAEVLELNLVQSKLLSVGGLDYVYFTKIAWSLNNNKLLLESFDKSLIIDLDKRKIYDLCFNDKGIELEWFPSSFFTSLDGKYVITHLSRKDVNYHYQFFDVLVDLDNKLAYQLPTPEYQDRIDWLVLP